MRKKHIKANKDRRDFIKKTGVSLGSLFVLPSHVLFGKKEIKDLTWNILKHLPFIKMLSKKKIIFGILLPVG